jgi:hypothetical protein
MQALQVGACRATVANAIPAGALFPFGLFVPEFSHGRINISAAGDNVRPRGRAAEARTQSVDHANQRRDAAGRQRCEPFFFMQERRAELRRMLMMVVRVIESGAPRRGLSRGCHHHRLGLRASRRQGGGNISLQPAAAGRSVK